MDSQDRLRFKRLLFNLLYPAVLGTLFVSLLPATADSLRGGVSMKLAVCWLIVAHFVIDYVFTEEVREYRALTFVLDFLVVVMLYVAFTAVQLEESGPIDARTISFAMAVVYASFIAWEYLSRHEIGSHLVLTAYESAAAIWFLVAGLVWPRNAWVLLLGLSAATVAMLIVCGGVIRTYHHGSPPTRLEGADQ
jgi:hypothetical protein